MNRISTLGDNEFGVVRNFPIHRPRSARTIVNWEIDSAVYDLYRPTRNTQSWAKTEHAVGDASAMHHGLSCQTRIEVLANGFAGYDDNLTD